MLIEPNSYLYVYVISLDFGFAPNPFHGFCTLATCKPMIRKGAKVGDWILGVGGSNLKKYGVQKKCILLMKVTEKMSTQHYWEDLRFSRKKPARNGSWKQMNGDNIYHKDNEGEWIQEDSHHSREDGSLNDDNLDRDIKRFNSDYVLISDYFFYFGSKAVFVNLEAIGYKNGIGQKKVNLDQVPNASEARELIQAICMGNYKSLNTLIADPCQFNESYKHYDQSTRKLSEKQG